MNTTHLCVRFLNVWTFCANSTPLPTTYRDHEIPCFTPVATAKLRIIVQGFAPRKLRILCVLQKNRPSTDLSAPPAIARSMCFRYIQWWFVAILVAFHAELIISVRGFTNVTKPTVATMIFPSFVTMIVVFDVNININT